MGAHEQVNELLAGFALGELSEQQSSQVRTHLTECRQCRDELKRLEAVLQCAASLQGLSPDEQACQSAKEALLAAVSDEETEEPIPRRHIRLDFVRRTIMKSKITKLAVAAAVLIAVLIVFPFIGGRDTGVALSDVLAKVDQARAYMYAMKMTMTGNMLPAPQEMTIIATVSDEYGMRWDMDSADPNTGEKVSQHVYVVPEQKMVVTIIPEKKQYMRMEFDDQLVAKMKQQNNDPREMIKQIMRCKYTELGRSVIDGVEVEGWRTTDPAVLGGATADVELTLWVDVENWLPFRSEMDMKMGDKMHVSGATYDFRWNVPVQASDFKPVIPDDFTPFPGDGMKMPGMTEEAAVEGLRLFAEMTGRYPKGVKLADFTEEISAFMPSLLEELKKMKQELGDTTGMTKEELRNAVMKKSMETPFLKKLMEGMGDTTGMTEEEFRSKLMKKSMETTFRLQAPAMFYMMLTQGKKEPAYYGESVGPDDANMVLMRWKAADNQYRVIFGDLTAGDVTPDELNDLESQLPKQ
jgi:outer membrane lipoprotein-sorting protein